ncbi:putative disease resistance RPP13-like protein 1 isoform X2 [Rosa chinensis]|uniref:putative disease resistance RPP13-like protein 1 isoform X2 n=1 Tax=Rosa chinensis TaxID=74649 RepID=UPI000D08D446|nr:putative disease resistance RPP13-like protein 1 isoform X2 [Rosa chinensis]
MISKTWLMMWRTYWTSFPLRCYDARSSSKIGPAQARKSDLGLIYIEPRSTMMGQRLPSSYVLDGPVVGRGEDKKTILEFLFRYHEPSTTSFHVVAIVGMPGIGKTTLAGHVFTAVKQFNPKVWVSVSDNFNLERVTKTIYKLVTSQHCDLDEFCQVQDNLREALEGKRFLIVLDDVWTTCDYNSWRSLQSTFHLGAQGSKIIVTTRDKEVAKLMGATEVYDLKTLSEEDCWQVFQQHVNNVKPPSFELTKKIVKNCDGLPLAAKTLGGILRCKETDKWEEVLNNRLWTVCDNSGILPVLKLSYHYLPSSLKRCFAYCSILPNDYEFKKKQLILLWMAEGLLQQSEGSTQMEDIGDNYFVELLSRSLFQNSGKNNSRYVMHDLVGDLARWAAGGTFFRLQDKWDGRCAPRIRHSSYISGLYDGDKKFENVLKFKRLRTFLPLSISQGPQGRQHYLSRKVAFDLVPKLESLRVLSFNGYQITELPDSIGHLKHLRYLDLSYTQITSLPEPITTLFNLQTLILKRCSHLKALPTNISNLTNLRHLNNSHVPSLEGMPAQLGQLTNLQTLCKFLVGKGSESGISEIGPLLNLRGTLSISRLQKVNDVEEARRADLTGKKGLDALELEWNGIGNRELEVLDMLKPHGKLRKLMIKGYGGLTFPKWIGYPSFFEMMVVRLENCKKCRFLPPLGQLCSLKELYITGMSEVESVGPEFYGDGSLPFPLLETLEFEDMKHWKEWFPWEQVKGKGVFPCLTMLTISRCPNLEGRLPTNLVYLSNLVIRECMQLVVSISNYKQLCQLNIDNCKAVVHRSSVEFKLLKVVKLASISEFRLQIEEFMRGLTSVTYLQITGCEELASSLQSEDRVLQHLMSLHELRIYKCQSLVSFPEGSLPSSLKYIWIQQCHSLTSFARYQIPSSVTRIEIRLCKKLTSLLGEKGEASLPSSSSPCLMQDESFLEYLTITGCPSLTSLSFNGHVPRALKHLQIHRSDQLESITESFYENNCLELFDIFRCSSLKSLPEGICHLTNLRLFEIWDCKSLVSFTRGGSPTGASNLNSLKILRIGHCEGLVPFLREGGFTANVTSIDIAGFDIFQLFSWGLHHLTSLRQLRIQGATDVVSFPPDENQILQLPKSLTRLTFGYFVNLIELSKGLQFLTSLQSLEIWDCPKLAFIPDTGLPLSLQKLSIKRCPEIEEKCKQGRGRYWPKILRIPHIQLGGSDSEANSDIDEDSSWNMYISEKLQEISSADSPPS